MKKLLDYRFKTFEGDNAEAKSCSSYNSFVTADTVY